MDKFGFAGLIELSRFGFLPLDLVAKYGMNRLIDSRNCYELIQRGFVIPSNKSSHHEEIRTIEELVSHDRGGMIISPQTGLHENVIVLDYDNQYANLIVSHNLSYETVLSKVEQGNQSNNKKGLLPTVVEKYLKRRLHFEALSKELSEDSREYLWCQQRIDSLKNILVCLYGTTGSLWNRFGNVLVFEEINRLSREILIKTKDTVQKLGYELIYDGKLVVSNNGADERGSRQIAYDPDKAYVIDTSNSSNLGKFYGWPDFVGNAEPVTDPKFKSPSTKEPLKFLIQDHPEVVKPLAQMQVGPSLTQVAYSNGSAFGHEGMAFIGASGTFTPITHTFSTIPKGIVGHKVMMLDAKTGNYSEFLGAIRDPSAFTPVGLAFDQNSSALYIADLGKLELRDTLPNGAPLNHTVTWPYPYTGIVWKVTRSGGGA